MSCSTHNWLQVPSVRANSSNAWVYAKREHCRNCQALRWSCLQCEFIGFNKNRSNFTVGNVSKHMLHQHGICTLESEQSSVVRKSKQPSLQDPLFSTFPITRQVVPQDDTKLRQLRLLVQNNLAFTIFDSSTWQELTRDRLDSWSSTSMKEFLRRQAISLRQEFIDKTLPRVPGISIVIDEWSDRQMIPWLGITICTMDVDFNFKLFSPGMQIINDSPTGANILNWLEIQLRRMNIEIVNLASVCTDNASNVSKAMSLNDHLQKVSTFCICHLVNIAVKRAIMNPAESFVHQDDEEDNADDIIQPTSKRNSTNRFWYYADEEEVATDVLPTQRSRVPSTRMAQYLQYLHDSGARDDANDEDHVASDSNDGLLLQSLWPNVTVNPNTDVRSQIVELVDRCRQVVKHVKNTGEARRQFELAQRKLYKLELTEFECEKERVLQECGASSVEFSALKRPLEPIALVKDVTTRWNSTLACICSIIENSKALENIWDAFGDGVKLFSEDQWQGLEAMSKFLLQFETITKNCEGDDVLASEGLVAADAFKKILTINTPSTEEDVASEHPFVLSMKNSMREHLKNHRAKLSRILSYLKPDSLAAYCACVDPRANELKFWNKTQRDTLFRGFMTYAVSIAVRWRGQQLNVATQINENESSYQAKRASNLIQSGTERTEISNYKLTEFGSNSDSSDENEDSMLTVQEEERVRQVLMDEYVRFRSRASDFRLNLKATSKKEERKAVLDWWREIKTELPTLSIVACTLFSVRISSASAERLFSYAGLVKTARRNKLGATLFDALVAFNYNDPEMQRHQ